MKIGIQTQWLWGTGLILASIIACFTLYQFGEFVGFGLIILPFVVAYIVFVFNIPAINAYMLIFYSFFSVFFGRYILKDTIPAGTLYDGLLVLGYIIVIVKGVTGKINWAKILDAPIAIVFIYLFYCILSLLIPESLGFDVWMQGVRVHLYFVLTIPLFCLLLDVKSLKFILVLWGVFSIIMSIKGFSQINIRLDAADQFFLLGNNFHYVNGKLRAFAYLSDAGQFGVQQAHAATIGAFLFLGAKNRKERWFYLILMATGIYGMFVSGTRGAIFVIFGGALLYCVVIRRIKLMLVSLICAGSFYCFMVFTDIGSNTYAIYRMRTAFKPEEDASYIARKLNRQILKDYLKTRPYGGGMGAMQFGPRGSILADTPFDSGYVLFWGDLGVVGLSMYIGIIILILIKGTWVVWFIIKNEWLRGVLIAMMAGITGVAVANYGNPVMAQHPTCVLYFLTIAIIYAAPRIDKSLREQEKNEQQPAITQVALYRK